MHKELFVDTERCLNFWNGGDSDRPLISFWIGTFSIPDLYPQSMKLLPDGELHPYQLTFDLFRQDYKDLFEKNLDSKSDIPWAAFPIMTIPWLEAILGCPIIKKGDNIWADPIDVSLEEFVLHPVRLENNQWLNKLLEFTGWLVELSDRRFPISVSLLRGPSDLLSATRKPTQMCLDFYDHPELILNAMKQITNIWIKTAHLQMDLIPSYMNGYSFGQIYLWAPKKCAWFQDDALALVSPSHYKHFLLPYEVQIASSIPYSGIHLHPRSLFVVDDLIDIPELDVIEINYEPFGPSLNEMLQEFKKILAKKRLVLWGEFSDQDLIFLEHNLPARNLCLQLNVPTVEKAHQKLLSINKIWKN